MLQKKLWLLKWCSALIIGIGAFAYHYKIASDKEISSLLEHRHSLVSSLSAQLSMKFEAYKAALSTLANSHTLVAEGDLEKFRLEAANVSQFFPGWLVLARAGDILDVVMITETSIDIPPPVPRRLYPEVILAETKAQESGKPSLSNSFISQSADDRVAVVIMPVYDKGKSLEYFLYFVVSSETLLQSLKSVNLPAGHRTFVVDSKKRIVSTYPEQQPGKQRSLKLFDQNQTRESPSGESIAFSQLDETNWTVISASPVSLPGWSVLLGGPTWLQNKDLIIAQSILISLLPSFFVLAIFYIFERILTERNLRIKVQQELAEKIELTKSLQSAEFRKNQLLGVVGHELKTPLISQLSVLDHLEVQDFGDNIKELIEHARRDGHDMLSVLDDLLEYAKTGAGNVVIAEERFCPNQVIKDVAFIIKPLIQRHENRLHTSLLSEVVDVAGDPNAIRRILINFGSNAAKFTHNGQITLSVEAYAISSFAFEIIFSVKDTGIGIGESDLTKIFDEFWVVEAAQPFNKGSSGLGLAICKALANAMNGQIDVKSQPGVGSEFRFRITLPVAPRLAPAEKEECGSKKIHDFTGMRVLIAEDHEVIRRVHEQQLMATGASVHAVPNGLVAVECASQMEFDLILMDLRMPQLGGVSAARQIREGCGLNAATVIIGLTAHLKTESANVLSNNSFNMCLSKPLDLDELTRALKTEAVAPTIAQDESKKNDDLFNYSDLVWLQNANPGLVSELLSALEADLEMVIPEIKESLSHHEFDDAADRAHKSAGLAKVVGSVALGNAFEVLESKARDGNVDEAERVMRSLSALIKKTLQEISNIQA